MPERTQPAQESRNRHESFAFAALRTRTRETPRGSEQTRRVKAGDQLRQPDPFVYHAALPAHQGSPHQAGTRRRSEGSRWRYRPFHTRLPALPARPGPRQVKATIWVNAFPSESDSGLPDYPGWARFPDVL